MWGCVGLCGVVRMSSVGLVFKELMLWKERYLWFKLPEAPSGPCEVPPLSQA